MAQEWGQWEELEHNYTALKRGIAHLKPEGLLRFVKNNRYSVQFYEHQTSWGLITQLLIRRHDSKPNISWADKQRIKNELIGPEATAIEVFPSQANLIDAANVHHVWILPPGFEIPFGLHFTGWSK